MFKVTHYSESGTRGDDTHIGIYDTRKLAQEAQDRYFDQEIGTLDEFLIANGYPLGDPEGIKDYKYIVRDFNNNVDIEELGPNY